MDKQDEAFLNEMRDHIEDTLENWMTLNVQEHIERTMIRHLTDISKLELEHEKKHTKRWTWLMTVMIVSIITNFSLMYMVYKLIKVLS